MYTVIQPFPIEWVVSHLEYFNHLWLHCLTLIEHNFKHRRMITIIVLYKNTKRGNYKTKREGINTTSDKLARVLD